MELDDVFKIIKGYRPHFPLEFSGLLNGKSGYQPLFVYCQ